MTACHHHSEEPALGLCIACRTPLCAECITKVDGINHCAPCLAQIAAQAQRVPTLSPRRLPGAVATGAGMLVLTLLAYTLLLGLLPDVGAP